MGGIVSAENLLVRIQGISGVLLLTMSVCAWVFFSVQAALSVFLGGGIVILSFQALKWQLRRAWMRAGPPSSKGWLLFSYYLRYLGTLFLVFLFVYVGWVHPLGFLVGLSTMVLSVIIVGGLEYLVSYTKRGGG